SRSGAFFGFSFRQNQRFALAQPDAVGGYPLGRTCVGPPLSDRAGTVGALLATAGSPTQTPYRLGTPVAAASAALVSHPQPGGGRRWGLRLAAVVIAVGEATTTDCLRHPTAPRCTPVLPLTSAQTRCYGQATPGGNSSPVAPTDSYPATHGLAALEGSELVRRGS